MKANNTVRLSAEDMTLDTVPAVKLHAIYCRVNKFACCETFVHRFSSCMLLFLC